MRLASVIGLVLLVTVGLVVHSDRSNVAFASTTGPVIGTLGTHPGTAKIEAAQGVKVAMMEVNWRDYEPQEGVFSASYAAAMVRNYQALKASGMQVTLGLGLQYTPAWALALPNSRFVDEYGKVSPEVNLVFNQLLRDQVNVFLARVNADLGFKNFWAVRIASGGESEVLYPQDNTYWAFDVNAQNGPNMPPTMAKNPLPGWTPGTPGPAVSQVNAWANWYVGALDDDINWQMGEIRSMGYAGYFQIVTPGFGVTPNVFSKDVANYLPDGVLGVGAAWDKIYGGIADKDNVVAYISSVGDGSGGNSLCSATDDLVPFNSPLIAYWSATRWISRVADQNGLLKAGENPGYNAASTTFAAHYSDASSKGLVSVSLALAKSCGFQAFYWAHDDQIWQNLVPETEFFSTPGLSTRTPAAAPALVQQ
jgi:hypothetical protein